MGQDRRHTKNNKGETNYLRPRHDVPEMPARRTDTLDLDTPAAIRFILTEQAAAFDLPIHSYMVVGRKNSPQDQQVDVDLGPFDAHKLGVSRYHAIITVVNGRISIKDFNSTNGTLLNGYVLQPMHAYRLRHGDELSLGELKIKIQFESAE